MHKAGAVSDCIEGHFLLTNLTLWIKKILKSVRANPVSVGGAFLRSDNTAKSTALQLQKNNSNFGEGAYLEKKLAPKPAKEVGKRDNLELGNTAPCGR